MNLLTSISLAMMAVAPQAPNALEITLAPFMSQAEITTPRRIAAFIGQCSVESARFTCTEENLHYSAERLCAVWPSHFPTVGDATPYADNPKAIASYVYKNRMGNGNYPSGDGWTFRGAGYIQLTGRANQEEFANQPEPRRVFGDIGDYLRTPKGAAESACWFWTKHNLNALADAWELTAISKVINGGTGALQERIAACNAALKALGGS
jgi:putative chitinase